MSRASALGALEYATETLNTGWAESSSTFGSRIAVLDAIDPSGLERAKADPARVVQRLQDGTMPIRTVFGGSFPMSLWLPGHGSTTAGAVTLEEHEDMLGYVLGNATSSGTGTTATGGTAAAPTTTSASGLTAGGIMFGGTKGDGRADGQPIVIGTHGSSTLTGLTALPAAMNNGDVLASSVMIYPTETAASAAVQSMRFRLLTANQQYACHGCYPTAVRFTGFNPGELPRAEVTWGVSRFSPVSATFPSTTSVDKFNPAPVAGGSLFVQNNGTTTRQTYTCRNFEINYELGIVPMMGPGGVDAAQVTVGAVRTPSVITVSFVVDSEAATATPTWPGRWDSDSQFYHLLYSLNGAATGQRVAVYLPNCCIVDRTPVQFNSNGVNSERITMRAYTGTTTTSELTMSAFRIALG